MEIGLIDLAPSVWRFRRAYGTRHFFVDADPALETPGYCQTVPLGPASVQTANIQQIC